MKKLLLTLALAATMTSLAVAQPSFSGFKPMKQTTYLGNVPASKNPMLNKALTAKSDAPKKAIKKGIDDKFDIRYCGDFYTWGYFIEQSRVDHRLYIYITPEMATQAAGNVIESITVSAYPSLTLASGKEPLGRIFVYEDMNSDPVASQDFVFEDLSSKYGVEEPSQVVWFEEPYTIKAGQGFYFGYDAYNCLYSRTQQMVDYPVGVGDAAVGPFAGTLELRNNKTGALIETIDMKTEVGYNAFLYATTTGPCKGFTNLFNYVGATVGTFLLPVFKAGSEENQIYGVIQNLGGNDLTTMEYQLTINGQDMPAATAALDIKPTEMGEFFIPLDNLEVGSRNDIKLVINTINGVAMEENFVRMYVIEVEDGFKRPMVVEEGTGAWCGNCPRGIVGMDFMSKTYPDDFIGIAVHGGDQGFGLDCEDYYPLIDAYLENSYPNCVANREPYYIFDPNEDFLEMVWLDYWKGRVGAAKVDLEVYNVKEDPTRLESKATVDFAFTDSENEYRLAYVILEDGLQGIQTNYYAGEADAPGDWGDKPKSVPWTYEHTARGIFDFQGIKGSIPKDKVKIGEPYTYEFTIPMTSVKKISETTIVCMIIDAYTGVIMNAVKVPFKDYIGEAGIDAINADASGLFSLDGRTLTLTNGGQVFSLDGRCVSSGSNSVSLNPGIYVIASQGKAAKVIVK